jgi:hypothetical protein
MTALFVLLPIFGFAAIFNIFLKKNISTSIFFSITAIISVLFVFGIFELLQIGSYLLFYGGIFILLIMSIIYNNKLFISLKSVPSIMFIFISIIYLYLMKDAQFFFWDEYSHWGQFIKDMYYFNSFYGANTNINHLNYPPGASIWDYFIVSNIFFSDGNIYFAYFLILFSSTLMMYERLTFKDIYWILLIFIIQIVIFASFGHWFSSIYVDHIIGAMFAGLILSYLSDNYNKKELFLFIFPLISIVLIKEIGLFFGLSFLGLVLFYRILQFKLENNQTILVSIKNNIRLFGILLILFISMILILKVWGARQESIGVQKEHQTISGITKSLFSDNQILDKKTKEEVQKRFWEVVNYQQLHKEKVSLKYNEFSYATMSKFTKNFKFSTTGIMIFFILMFVLLYFSIKNKNKRINISIIYGYMFFVNISYLFILYFSFLVAFGNDALRIPSYVRYINMSTLPMLIIGFSLMLPIYNKKKDYKLFILPLIVVFILGYITSPYIKPMYSQQENGFRKTADKLSINILKNIPEKSKIFVIFPIKNNGSLNNILKYSLIPLNTTISSFNFEKKSFQEMLKVYVNYKYIWFVQLNKKLVQKNMKILKQNNKQQVFSLYKIEKSNNQIKFIPIL